MINVEEFTVPDYLMFGERKSLASDIPAIQLVQKNDGTTQLGLLTQLPAGTTVEICGHGFNERTTKVRVFGLYYFVYLQDIDPPRVSAATA